MERGFCHRTVLLLAGIAMLPPSAAGSGHLWDLDLRDFAVVEKAYIPALALTSAGQAEPARRALAVFRERWEGFKARYRQKTSEDAQWQEDTQEIDTLLAEAAAAMGQGRPVSEAHESLEAVRFVFQSIRRRHDSLYILDGMTDFHEVMEGIAAYGARPLAPLTEAEKADLTELLDEARALWKGVRERGEDATYFGFTEVKRTKLAELFTREDDALVKVRAALQAGDVEGLRSAAAGVKPPYAEAFRLFGE